MFWGGLGVKYQCEEKHGGEPNPPNTTSTHGTPQGTVHTTTKPYKYRPHTKEQLQRSERRLQDENSALQASVHQGADRIKDLQAQCVPRGDSMATPAPRGDSMAPPAPRDEPPHSRVRSQAREGDGR